MPEPNLLQRSKAKDPLWAQYITDQTQYLVLILLLLLYVIVAGAHTCLAPLTTGPDELAHYEYVRFIAEHGRLPLTTEERKQASYKSDQPPLYHLLAALPAGLVDPTGPPFLKRYSDHSHRQLIERTRHAWGLYNTEDEQWPYRAEVLRWHAGRWVAILFGLATVAVTFFIARDLFARLPLFHEEDGAAMDATRTGTKASSARLAQTNYPPSSWLPALGTAAVVAFIPRFALTGSMLNYETTLAFLAALFLWVLLRMADNKGQLADDGRWMAAGTRSRFRAEGPLRAFHVSEPKAPYGRFTLHALLLGLLAGLAITAKLSAIILLLEIVVALWLIKRHQGWTWATWGRGALLAGTATLLAVSWWFGFIIYQFNTVATDGLWTGLLRPLLAADASDATTNRLLNFLTGGQAGFTGAIENLDSGPPWEWLAILFRTFWMVGIEAFQPLAPTALVVALALCLVAAWGLSQIWWSDRRPVTGDRQRTNSSECLILSLLLLHLGAAFILPGLRYAATFSLADTAQGRHILFLAGPAFAILLIWGLNEAVSILPSRFRANEVARRGQGPLKPKAPYGWALQSQRSPGSVSRFIFTPGLFLLAWTGVQLWYMSWAYNPLLPVQTVPAAKAQATQQLDQPLNDAVTLAGYNSQFEQDGHLLRLELIWEALAISPVDYLTEVSLLDAQGAVQAQWLGYAANGRYPTRAWDVGDIVRDTVWLPLAGLAPGRYRLQLQLLPTNRYPLPGQAPLSPPAPLILTEVTLQNPPLRTFNGGLPFTGQAIAAAGYSVWQNGQALVRPETFHYRETVLITLSPLLPGQQRTVHLIGPTLPTTDDGPVTTDQPQIFAPVRELNNTVLFIVGPDWPTGDYHLQVTLSSSGEVGDTAEQVVNSGPILQVIDLWERRFNEPPISHRVEANFANQVKLLGYDLGAKRAEPGGGIPLTLYWQGLDWLGNDYTIFTRLLAADQTAHGGRDRLPHEGYRTLYWAPNEIVIDPFGAPVEADAPEGIYHLVVGLYQQVGQEAISLPLVQDGQVLDATSITLGSVKIGDTPPGLTQKSAVPQHPVNQSFGDGPNLTLLGYDLTHSADQSGQHLKLTLYWRCETPLAIDYTTFVHVRNAAGEVVAQQDQPPLKGAYPTSLWNPGEIIADTITVPLAAELPAGEYQLVIGLYDLATGVRLTIPGSADNSLPLRKVKIAP